MVQRTKQLDCTDIVNDKILINFLSKWINALCNRGWIYEQIFFELVARKCVLFSHFTWRRCYKKVNYL